ncbi:MAG: acyl-CoA thioesterase [Candidatus Marinimicrobia bacterium]|nr:acyl-CoA thioesterase [Candidatus Neomarinimicrobiota bacterium]
MREMSLSDFPLQSYDKIRYGDTDRQGHVNNAKFATFFETGRVEILYSREHVILDEKSSFVAASVKITFLKEINWPGTVEVGTGIIKIGNSSIHLFQQLHQNGECVAEAESVSVQVLDKTGKSHPLTQKAKTTLERWVLTDL